MHASQIDRLGQVAVREAPPHWSVVTVRSCVVGLLALPVVMPLALATGALAPFRPLALGLSVALWVGLLVCAQLVVTTHPPVQDR
jgi:hypothetical protein